jgi:hypothetical protein
MTGNIIRFINLLAFGFVVSQPFFYLLAMTRVQKNMRAASYIELRNLLHKNLNVTLRIVYSTALVTSVAWCGYTMIVHLRLQFISAAIALVALLIDVFYLFKGDMPVNKIIQTWTPENYPDDWETYRAKWLSVYRIRQVADIIGFISLLAGETFLK